MKGMVIPLNHFYALRCETNGKFIFLQNLINWAYSDTNL